MNCHFIHRPLKLLVRTSFFLTFFFFRRRFFIVWERGLVGDLAQVVAAYVHHNSAQNSESEDVGGLSDGQSKCRP
jgi:hypothetical protein